MLNWTEGVMVFDCMLPSIFILATKLYRSNSLQINFPVVLTCQAEILGNFFLSMNICEELRGNYK